MSLWCKYSDMFGEPKKGLHQYRLFDIAIVDVVFTLIGAYILCVLYGFVFKTHERYFTFAVILFTIGIVMHRLFCVETTIDKLIFGPSLA